MEYVAGVSFRGLVDSRVPAAIAARAIAEAARGLHAAHEVRDSAGHVMGVVHRDISPDNLMLGYDGHVKVIDFGIALVRNRQAPVTELGTIKGKPPYMSPEQVKNLTMDRRSDVFSLAVVLYELLTGAPLFQGDSIYAVALAVEQAAILPPALALGRALPPGLDSAVMRALDRRVEHRTPTAAAFADELEGVLNAVEGEALEAWAARELAGPRAAHRAWLATVVAGRDAPRPAGRATGAVTQLSAAQQAAMQALAGLPTLGASAPEVAPVAPGAPAEAAGGPPDEHLGEASLGARASGAASRRRAAWVALALLGLVAGALVVTAIALSAHRGGAGRGGAELPLAAAGGVDAGGAIAPVADAAPVAEGPAPRGSAAPPDAGERLTPAAEPRVTAPPPRRPPPPRPRPDAHAARPPHGSAAAPPPVAAPPPAAAAPAVPAVTGIGRITIVARDDSFLNILLDGKPFAVTPQIDKPIAAGSHVVELIDPKTNAVIHRETVTVAPGQRVRVRPPAGAAGAP
jgi:serine/threonine-protein kinase